MSSSAIEGPSLSLRDGTVHPAIGFGTYKVGFVPASATAAATESAPQRSARECVKDALDVGYRLLECAEFYGNEEQVGLAIQDAGVNRKDLFLVSKVWTTTIEKGPDAVAAQLEKTLRDLQTDYLDLYLIHWPVPQHHVEAYKKLIELKAAGKIKNVGVSNYAWEDYLELKEAGITDLPAVNQIEINPFLYRKKTIQKFQEEGVVMQSYRSLRDGKQMENHVLLDVASHYPNKTVAQILGRWCIQKGFVYIPKSVKKSRMIENAQVFDFVLSEQDMTRLDALTTTDNLNAFQDLYRKCVNRDTSKDGTMEGVKMDITLD
ncbi:2,5-diketo-D-gluconate reductase A [Fistulifera solaris]|jgi:diketogulonate reductase-like aldo/keto reductase|uniref:2,5-diketo-D-gluconate reductase A n=1 Tax=Fistulifera solaris TaxID=1519565 RepID=A0A1Z5JTP9_FISSO|nr:2,5-diketo-D-gluconate reductase A [Fistulifera solaris]|eukprot:GAX17403.1 2,5-diketo-D-gluconate reductase A [Fistulifera solaris]